MLHLATDLTIGAAAVLAAAGAQLLMVLARTAAGVLALVDDVPDAVVGLGRGRSVRQGGEGGEDGKDGLHFEGGMEEASSES